MAGRDYLGGVPASFLSSSHSSLTGRFGGEPMCSSHGARMIVIRVQLAHLLAVSPDAPQKSLVKLDGTFSVSADYPLCRPSQELPAVAEIHRLSTWTRGKLQRQRPEPRMSSILLNIHLEGQ